MKFSDAEIVALAETWSAEARERAAEAMQAIRNGERRAWYCRRGRKCDGKPHEGYMYPHARGDQWPPPGTDWRRWFLSGGRGSGKTRTGAEYARKMSEKVGRMALVAPTGADVRDTMIEGESGLMFVAALAGMKLDYEPSKRRLTFPNGCIATTFSGEQPARLRGPQFGFAWLDEPAHMPLIEEVWSNLSLGLRLGERPHVVLTSTPLPSKWVKKIQGHRLTKVVRVSTFDNADNLSESYIEDIREEYEGTRLGLQELYGQVLSDVVGSLWKVDHLRREPIEIEDLERIVVGIDPAGSANRRSDETGIVVAGMRGRNAWVLHDASGKYSPKGWADKAYALYQSYNADAIVAEVNFGADMVEEVIRRNIPTTDLPPRIVKKRASRGKQLRAEPIVALYEQERVFHWGNLADLEDEMLTWVPGYGDSPNRVDALVWALADLMQPAQEAKLASPRRGTMRPRTFQGVGPHRSPIDFSKLRRNL
jgi:phage terminase large subunit-like protein